MMNDNLPSELKHIVFIGRKNVGKSALINAFAGQDLSIVSDVPGTTTDPVKKLIELLPYGAVVLVDTAGIDNINDLGGKRISKTMKILSSANFAIVVLDARERLSKEEIELFVYLNKIKLPFVIAVNKIEYGINPDLLRDIKELKAIHFEISVKEEVGLDILKSKIIRLLPYNKETPLIKDLVKQGDIIIFVVPQELETPEGGLIPPQIQAVKEALDKQTIVIVTKESELQSALNKLSVQPSLVVSDSRTIIRVLNEVPEGIKLTTFSILLARQKGDLSSFIQGLKQVDKLQNGDKILIAEACLEHPLGDDIGRIKIPMWLKQYTKKDLDIEVKSGAELPDNLADYRLIIHCGGCMLARSTMISRLKLAALMDIPVVNYGILISYIHGAIPRALLPFKEAINAFNNY
ncbi:MAG: [FeFe] hydrogenase H-cluster maturation GTPase HydF [Bacteroidota bacterium]|nr:[FeFe] hydrogenase H-cluster maturation GTPase HydF [Bacteroidota bacterium]